MRAALHGLFGQSPQAEELLVEVGHRAVGVRDEYGVVRGLQRSAHQGERFGQFL